MRKSWVWQLSERKAFPSIDENNTNIMPKGIAHNRCTMILTIFCVNICYQGSKKNNLDSTFVIALFLFTRIFSLWSFRFGRRKRNSVISKNKREFQKNKYFVVSKNKVKRNLRTQNRFFFSRFATLSPIDIIEPAKKSMSVKGANQFDD